MRPFSPLILGTYGANYQDRESWEAWVLEHSRLFRNPENPWKSSGNDLPIRPALGLYKSPNVPILAISALKGYNGYKVWGGGGGVSLTCIKAVTLLYSSAKAIGPGCFSDC